MRKIMMITLALMSLASCATTKQFAFSPSEEFTRAFKGSSSSEVMQEFGKPVSVTPESDGRFMMRFEKTVEEFLTFNEGDAGVTTEESSSESAYSSNKVLVYKNFYFDNANSCYKVETNDYLKGGEYRKYYDRMTIAELSGIGVFFILLNFLL